MGMSKKVYETVAQVIAAERMVQREGRTNDEEILIGHVQEDVLNSMTERFLEIFAADSPHFRPEQFERESRRVRRS